MQKTSSAPSTVNLTMNNNLPVWTENPHELQDTLSAYAGCVWRAIVADSLEAALTWTDTMLALNPTSLIAYRDRADVYNRMGETTLSVTAYDSAVAIAERYGDPALPDSVFLNKWQSRWYELNKANMAYLRWCVANHIEPGYR